MNIHAYKTNCGNKELLFVGSAKNKEEMRQIILNHNNMQKISSVGYGKKEYTMSDIYAGR